MTTVFVVPGKVTVKLGDGGDVGIKKIDQKRAKISFIQFYLKYPCLKSEIMTIKCINMSFVASRKNSKLILSLFPLQ